MTARDRTPIVHAPGVLRIPLTRGLFALIDEADAPLIAPHLWCALKARNTNYAMRITPERKTVYMHRLLLGLTLRGERADHMNFDGLDNRRSNLRRATTTQNAWNVRQKYESCLIGTYLGQTGKWKARVRHNGRRVFLGSFASEIEAAHAYDAFVRETRGEFAVTNFK